MIKTEVLTSTIPLCQRLFEAKKIFVVGEYSPVAAVAESMYTPLVDTFHGETGFIEAFQAALALDNPIGAPKAVSLDNHDESEIAFIPTNDYVTTLEEASNAVAQGALLALNHAKNVASPIIDKVYQSVEEIMSESASAREDVEIFECNDAEAWGEPIIQGAISKHTGRGTRMTAPRVPIPENIEEYLNSGSANLDAIFNKLLSDCSMSATDAVAMLLDGGDHGAWPEPAYLNKNLVLIKYLVASLLAEKPLPNSGMGLEQWETALLGLQDTYGVLCNMIATEAAENREAKWLVLGQDYSLGRIYVDGKTYDTWLEAGGSPEILIGAYTARTSVQGMTFEALLENAEVHKGQWSNYHALKQLKLESGRTARLREAVLSGIRHELYEMDSSLLPESTNMDKIEVALRKKVDQLSTYELETISTCLIGVVCDVLFPHTKAKFIIERMTARKDEGYDQKTAEAIVISEYITWWVLSGASIADF